MLALTRKIGERLVIGEHIIVTVVDVKGDSVRIAIEAPREIKIYRGELLDAIVQENRDAAAPPVLDKLDILKDVHKSK